jgi:hypothetical protein
VKPEDHDIGASILRMSRVMTMQRGIRILMIAATDLYDLQRTALLTLVLDHVNCV